MIVVLDSNVLISAFITNGVCHKVLAQCIESHQPVISPFIKDEINRIFLKKLKYHEEFFQKVNDFIIEFESANPPILKNQICKDRDDDNILALAVDVKADIIITGDNDLLEIQQFENIPIIKPNQFWKFIDDH